MTSINFVHLNYLMFLDYGCKPSSNNRIHFCDRHPKKHDKSPKNTSNHTTINDCQDT